LIDPSQFVCSVKPLLEARDFEGLLCHLKAHWSAEQIVSLLSASDPDVRKVAALALSLVGGKCCIPAVADRLRDLDAMTNQMAEHALWSIWFRCGTPAANAELARGAQCLGDHDFDCAFEHLNRAIAICPGFAEAYNQKAIAYYLMEDYEQSRRNCQITISLMPCHFGAWAGLGHCHAHLGNLPEAIKCYEKALEINPHLDCIRQAVHELRQKQGGSFD
jgi:tetratricopeptide (TPR) repeat protein